MNYDIKLSGKRIADLRNKSGISQEYLAEKVGMHPKTISKVERGVNGLSVDNLIVMAEYFSVSLEFLVGIDESINEGDYIISLYNGCPNERKKLLVEVMRSFQIVT